MKWLEIIELRSIKSDRDLMEHRIKELLGQVERKEGKQGIMVFSRVLIDTDFSIHLHHYSDGIDNEGSRLGLHLVSILKEFGIVNHSIWAEMHGE